MGKLQLHKHDLHVFATCCSVLLALMPPSRWWCGALRVPLHLLQSRHPDAAFFGARAPMVAPADAQSLPLDVKMWASCSCTNMYIKVMVDLYHFQLMFCLFHSKPNKHLATQNCKVIEAAVVSFRLSGNVCDKRIISSSLCGKLVHSDLTPTAPN